MKRMVKVSRRSVDALDRSAETRSASTVARVRGAIFSLLDKKMPVTLATIHRETQLLDPAAKPVATSTILRNPETTVLYHAHATERPRSRIVIADRALVKMLRHTKRDLACALNGKRCSVGTLRSLGAWLNWGDGRAPRYDRIGHPHWSASEAYWAGRGSWPTVRSAPRLDG